MALVTVTLTVQTAAADPLESVRYTVLDSGETTVLATGVTDTDGLSEEMSLEEDTTYSVRLVSPYTTFTDPETIVVVLTTDPQDFILEGTSAVVTYPSGLDLCCVYGQAIHTNGDPYAEAIITIDNLFGEVIATPWSTFGPRVSGVTSSTGRFEVEVLRGSTVRIAIQGTNIAARVVIPDQSMVHINTLLADAEDEIQDVVE